MTTSTAFPDIRHARYASPDITETVHRRCPAVRETCGRHSWPGQETGYNKLVKSPRHARWLLLLGWGIAVAQQAAAASTDTLAPAKRAAAIIEAAGIHGGLVVHLGCGDGVMTAALHQGENYAVHGLDANAASVEKARGHIHSLGLYGKVSIDRFDGARLPYVDNLVNLIVVSGPSTVDREEILRVLCPGGVLVKDEVVRTKDESGGTKDEVVRTKDEVVRTKDEGGGAKDEVVRTKDESGAARGEGSAAITLQTPVSSLQPIRKPWPDEIDQWSHYLHDASGNAVASDDRAGVPRHAQWICEPRWPRSHEYTPSISAMVSSGGKVFYIMDDGPRGLFDSRFPEKWAIYARDAFNGVLLWKHPFAQWGPSQWNASGHWSTPMSLSRRLVSSRDRVYVTLGYRATVSVLNAATGGIVGVYDQTKNTDEIVLQGGILLARCRKEVPDYPRGATAWDVTVRRSESAEASPLASASIGDEKIVAVDTETGTTLWEKPEKRIVTLSLASLGSRVCYHTFEELVCLELDSGKEVWRERSEPWPDLTGTGVSLVMYKDVVLMTSSEGLVARSLETGETLWRGPRIPRHAPRQPADLLIADGLLWTSLTPEMPMGTVPKQPMDTPRVTGTAVQGLDPRTGELRRTVDIGQLISVGHHVRCYRSKGTNQYLLWPKRGIEFVDIRGPGEGEGPAPRNGSESASSHMRCDWTRGECSYGVMPANGLLYVPPHPCVCYTGVALNGFNAFAAKKRRTKDEGRRTKEERLERGPDYDEIRPSSLALRTSTDWPTYRHDAARSGSTAAAVPTDLQTRWTVKVGERLTQPVIADGKVFIASVDEHAINCLDAETGHRCWSYTAGGRIDSSPTFHNHLVLFGCRDGWVYCLRASDGTLVWRFQAAPEERRMVAFGQVESAWGVHGSVVLVDDTVYFAAGRSSFLDGGIYLYGLEPATGRILHQAHLVGPWPDVRTDQGQPYHMEGAKSDVLVSDGTHLYMFHNKFDLELNQVKTTPRGAGGDRVTGLRLTTTSGFLDDTLHDRFYWFHNQLWPGSHFAVRGPKSGHIMVFDELTTYGQRAFSRRERLSPKFTPGGEGYLLFADHSDTQPLMDRKSGRGTEYRPGKPSKWSTHVPVRALAMVLTKDMLFLAGPPDTVPADDPFAALEGKAGAKLWAVSPEDGKRLAEWPLKSPPVFDGMSAAGGRLFVAQTNGTLTCMGSGHKPDRRRVDGD